MNIPTQIMGALLALMSFQTHALQITSLSPQGEIGTVRQVVAQFDQAAVSFGDPKAPPPLNVTCSDNRTATGSGRWIGDKEWVFQFENDLPPGVRCTVKLRKEFVSPKGAALTADPVRPGGYQFNTGGPVVLSIRPYPNNPDQPIEEEQFFVLRLNGAATLQSIQDNVWCSVQGLGERVPVKLLDGTQRAQLLEAQGNKNAAAADPLSFVTLACNRRLTPSADVQLVYGKGVRTPAQGTGAPNGVANSTEKRFNYKVREPFSVSFTCERESAQSACMPIRPMAVNFNSPVPRKLAEAIRLRSGKDSLKPDFDKSDAEGDVNHVTFNGIFTERTQFTLELPKDQIGRAHV